MPNCFSDPSYVLKDVSQGLNFSLLTETAMTANFQLYVDAFGNCVDAKTYAMGTELPTLMGIGIIIKDGSFIPPPSVWVASPGTHNWSVSLNGAFRGTISADEGVITDNTNISWPLTMDAGFTFLMTTGAGDAMQIPGLVCLDGFDPDPTWCCATNCCAPPSTPRKGMQVFSNYTWAVNNSFGQVPKV